MWLGTWKYRHKITIDASKIDADLSHFPVLVHLSSTSGSGNDDVTDIFDELGSNKYKIAFTKSDGITQLYGEIEKWDNTNELADIWVSNSGLTLDDTDDTILYIYFDNSQSDNTDYIGLIDTTAGGSVWNSDFKVVYHMIDATTSTIKDSTSNNHDGTKKAANEPIEADGKVAKAQDFDGSNDSIQIPDSDDFYFGTGDFTIEFLINFDTAAHSILGQSVGGGNNLKWALNLNDVISGKLVFDFQNPAGSPYDIAFSWSPSISTWYHCVLRKISNAYSFYVDNTQVGTDITQSAEVPNVADSLALGVDGENWRFLNGKLDEVRISKGVGRSTPWIKATYNSVIDALIKNYAVREQFTGGAFLLNFV